MRVALIGVITSLVAFCGCATEPHLLPTELVPVPTVRAERFHSAEPTALERLQEMSRRYEAEKGRADRAQSDCDAQKAEKEKAQADTNQLQREVTALSAQAKQCDILRVQLDEAQKVALELEGALRQLRRELLEERLVGARREQTILSMKIERAMERRKQAISQLPGHKEVASVPATQTEKQ